MYCMICRRNINAIGQDNVSSIPGYPMCEDCGSGGTFGGEQEAFEKDFELILVNNKEKM